MVAEVRIGERVALAVFGAGRRIVRAAMTDRLEGLERAGGLFTLQIIAFKADRTLLATLVLRQFHGHIHLSAQGGIGLGHRHENVRRVNFAP